MNVTLDMPLFYTYKGFRFFIYSNDHNPPHIHVKRAENELKIKYWDLGGAIMQDFEVLRHGKFSAAELRDIDDFAREYRLDMLAKWDNFMINGVKPQNKRINIIRKHAKKRNKKSS